MKFDSKVRAEKATERWEEETGFGDTAKSPLYNEWIRFLADELRQAYERDPD